MTAKDLYERYRHGHVEHKPSWHELGASEQDAWTALAEHLAGYDRATCPCCGSNLRRRR